MQIKCRRKQQTQKIILMSRELYPLKFVPVLKEKIWGGNKLSKLLNKAVCKDNIGESWEISGVKGSVSVVSNGFLQGHSLVELIEVYKSKLLGKSVFEKFGSDFPLLIKYIDAKETLSVQVHPDDEVAKARHNSFGKTEMWFVLDAEKGAGIINGFKRDTNKEEYEHAVRSGKLIELLNVEEVNAGDVFLIPAGRIHAIGKGIMVAEIQQTSDITYRVFDWNRTDDKGRSRELHTDLALDVLNYKSQKQYKKIYKSKNNDTVNLIDCKYFTTNIIILTKNLEKDYSKIDSFVIYLCLEGEFYIHSETETVFKISKGETVLIPATMRQMELKSDKISKLLEVYITT